MKKGKLAMDEIIKILLVLIGLILLIFFIYYLRDRMKEFIEVIFNIFK